MFRVLYSLLVGIEDVLLPVFTFLDIELLFIGYLEVLLMCLLPAKLLFEGLP